jgi:flagellar biosynthesis GTPase FlhF
MSEKYPSHHQESAPSAHEGRAEHHHNRAAEHELSQAEKLRHKHEQAEHLEHARDDIEHEAKSAEQIAEKLAARESQPQLQHNEAHANRELKEMAYQRLLTRARRHMRPYSRAMSHIIHQPVVDAVSEVSAKTIGRPSGLLGGGFIALVGTSAYYYITRHYGYNYNSFVFLTLMACGFVLGWMLEIAYKSLRITAKK